MRVFSFFFFIYGARMFIRHDENSVKQKFFYIFFNFFFIFCLAVHFFLLIFAVQIDMSEQQT